MEDLSLEAYISSDARISSKSKFIQGLSCQKTFVLYRHQRRTRKRRQQEPRRPRKPSNRDRKRVEPVIKKTTTGAKMTKKAKQSRSKEG